MRTDNLLDYDRDFYTQNLRKGRDNLLVIEVACNYSFMQLNLIMKGGMETKSFKNLKLLKTSNRKINHIQS